ncbi:MAG: amino acid ABC transporter permease [Pseudolabrys sp.]|nr:amino acid ABC transporter permease [Pseudolabrys sp.]
MSNTPLADLPVLLSVRRLPNANTFDGVGAIRMARAIRWPALAAGLILVGAANGQTVGPSEAPDVVGIVIKWMPLIGAAFLFNLLVSVASMAIGTALGFIPGLGQISVHKGVRDLSWLVTQFFRNAPWLVLIFFAMFLLPFEIRVGPITIPLPAWFKAVIGLALPVMANVAEIVRGGILAIPIGQWESAESLAFSRRQIIWQIIMPQAFKQMIPPWMNLYAILTMATTLISVVGIQDSMTVTRSVLVAEARTELYLPFYFVLLLMFFVYCYPIARLTQTLERRYAVLS